jgi:tRNA threonylcarbamoyladenosine biosynthesis protein TsaE
VTRLVSSSPEETEGLGARLAERLVPTDVVAVAGELGAGKTTFIRGACRALGVTQPVTSPTYTIGNRYEGARTVSHLDLYRLETVSESDWAALEPYFEDAIVFVEWPEAGAGRVPAARVTVRLEHVDRTHREIVFETGQPDLLVGLDD